MLHAHHLSTSRRLLSFGVAFVATFAIVVASMLNPLSAYATLPMDGENDSSSPSVQDPSPDPIPSPTDTPTSLSPTSPAAPAPVPTATSDVPTPPTDNKPTSSSPKKSSSPSPTPSTGADDELETDTLTRDAELDGQGDVLSTHVPVKPLLEDEASISVFNGWSPQAGGAVGLALTVATMLVLLGIFMFIKGRTER